MEIAFLIYLIVAIALFFIELNDEYPNDTIQDRMISLVLALLWPVILGIFTIISAIEFVKRHGRG